MWSRYLTRDSLQTCVTRICSGALSSGLSEEKLCERVEDKEVRHIRPLVVSLHDCCYTKSLGIAHEISGFSLEERGTACANHAQQYLTWVETQRLDTHVQFGNKDMLMLIGNAE